MSINRFAIFLILVSITGLFFAIDAGASVSAEYFVRMMIGAN